MRLSRGSVSGRSYCQPALVGSNFPADAFVVSCAALSIFFLSASRYPVPAERQLRRLTSERSCSGEQALC
jgi:hypothetical protein